MHFGRVGRVYLVVHSADSPNDVEWNAWISDMERSVDTVAGLFVWTAGGGPDASQRRSAQAFWGRVGRKPVAICNGSTVVRGIITALNWVAGRQFRSFPLEAAVNAAISLGLTRDEYSELADSLERFAYELDIRTPSLESAVWELRRGGVERVAIG